MESVLRPCYSSFALNTRKIAVKKLIPIVALALASMACGERANAQPLAPPNDQHVISDQDIALMRQDIRSHKKQLVAQSLTLTDAEATRFWPIYDRYVAEPVSYTHLTLPTSDL